MFVFVSSGMRRRQSTASWYFCVWRYWEVYPGFWTGLDELCSHSEFLLVLCPDWNFVHSHNAFPRGQGFVPHTTMCFLSRPSVSCILQVTGVVAFVFPLLSTKWKSLTMQRAYWYWKFWGWRSTKPLRTAWYWLVLLTEFCPITVIWIYFKASCSIVGRSQSFIFLVPTC